ncbi:hypothetical protein DFH09DRAFT_1279821 [Mycena vulgaris]|nr:hypothetical protein DFH09DRAFT_1279821 [Mycena vulgaris]
MKRIGRWGELRAKVLDSNLTHIGAVELPDGCDHLAYADVASPSLHAAVRVLTPSVFLAANLTLEGARWSLWTGARSLDAKVGARIDSISNRKFSKAPLFPPPHYMHLTAPQDDLNPTLALHPMMSEFQLLCLRWGGRRRSAKRSSAGVIPESRSARKVEDPVWRRIPHREKFEDSHPHGFNGRVRYFPLGPRGRRPFRMPTSICIKSIAVLGAERWQNVEKARKKEGCVYAPTFLALFPRTGALPTNRRRVQARRRSDNASHPGSPLRWKKGIMRGAPYSMISPPGTLLPSPQFHENAPLSEHLGRAAPAHVPGSNKIHSMYRIKSLALQAEVSFRCVRVSAQQTLAACGGLEPEELRELPEDSAVMPREGDELEPEQEFGAAEELLELGYRALLSDGVPRTRWHVRDSGGVRIALQ